MSDGKKAGKGMPRGFTLIELIIVVALVGILAAISIPSFLSMAPDYKLKGAAQNLYSSMQKVKLEAVKRNTSVAIAFTLATGNYQVFVDDGGTTGTAANATLDGDELLLFQKTLPASCSLVSATFGSTNDIRTGFNSRALPLGARVGNVELKNSQTTRRYKLTLSQAGHTRLQMSNDNGSSWE